MHSQGSPTRGTISEVAASPLPSRGPTRGRICYATPAFSMVPNKGDKIRSGCLTLAFSGAHKRAVLRHPCILGGEMNLTETFGLQLRCRRASVQQAPCTYYSYVRPLLTGTIGYANKKVCLHVNGACGKPGGIPLKGRHIATHQMAL